MRIVFRPLPACLSVLMLAAALPAAAQFGPGNLPEPGPRPGPQNNPDPPRPAQPDNLGRPAFLQTGYQLTYTNATSNLGGLLGRAEESSSFIEYTVIGSTPDKAYIAATTYVSPTGVPRQADGRFDPAVDHQAQLASVMYYTVDAERVMSGQALWMPPAALQGMREQIAASPEPGPGQDPKPRIDPVQWPFQGQVINANGLLFAGQDFASLQVYHPQTGLKLATRVGNGPLREGADPNDVLNRNNQYRFSFAAGRQIQSPIIGQAFPEWTANLKSMSYQGTYTLAAPDTEPVTLPMTMLVEFESVVDNLALGSTIVSSEGSDPVNNALIIGPGSLMSFWASPQTLAQLEPGEISRNPTLRTTLTYQVQEGHLGKLGVFVLTNDAQTFWSVAAYNLQGGRLMYTQYAMPQQHTTIEFELQNVQQR